MGRDEQEPSDLSVDMVIQIMLSLCIKEEDGQWWTVTSRGGFSDCGDDGWSLGGGAI